MMCDFTPLFFLILSMRLIRKGMRLMGDADVLLVGFTFSSFILVVNNALHKLSEFVPGIVWFPGWSRLWFFECLRLLRTVPTLRAIHDNGRMLVSSTGTRTDEER
jgi:hypothetical protein